MVGLEHRVALHNEIGSTQLSAACKLQRFSEETIVRSRRGLSSSLPITGEPLIIL